jgi:multidrug efflux pump subunit AcrA (membrane-fusion protein)
MPGITKKRSLYASDTDGRCLDQLSKAAVIDILVEYLRCDTDCCDSPLTAAEVAENDRIRAVLTARGDRLLPREEAILAKEAKRKAKHDSLQAQWTRAKEARLARDAAMIDALKTLGH